MKYAIITILSISLTVCAGLFMPETFDTREELSSATFGFPLPIFLQEIHNSEKVTFPWTTNLASPLENNVNIFYGNFIIDTILFWIALYIVLRTRRKYLLLKS